MSTLEQVLAHLGMALSVVFIDAPLFVILGIPISVTLAMVLMGFLTGIIVGATPGLAGPMAMAVALPILLSVFGVGTEALLPVVGFLIGIMKGATVGGAVPAILFNTPGTPDALLTTFDGFPMAKRGQARKALRVAHFSSATGDTFSDIVLITSAPFLAIIVERFLGLPEKAALIILSMSFIAAIVGNSVAKGLLSASLGLLTAYVATGDDFYPRLSMGTEVFADGFPIVTAVLGVLILGEVFKALEDLIRNGPEPKRKDEQSSAAANAFDLAEVRQIFPYIRNSALIGTAVGALPGVGSTLAATLGYSSGKRRHAKNYPEKKQFGDGVPEGIAATEAANSAVSGANLIPVLSLGIPGNAAAVFLILAFESIGGFNPGLGVFSLKAGVTGGSLNPELVAVIGIFVIMMLANGFNWTIGGLFMRFVGVLSAVPKHLLLPVILLLTLTGIYVESTDMITMIFAIGFGVLGYFMRKLDMSVLPFVIAFILGRSLERTSREAFASTGGDVYFLFSSWICIAFLVLAGLITVVALIRSGDENVKTKQDFE